MCSAGILEKTLNPGNFVFCGEQLANILILLGGTNSETTKLFSILRLFKPLQGSAKTLAAVIPDFSALSGTNRQMVPDKTNENHLHHSVIS